MAPAHKMEGGPFWACDKLLAGSAALTLARPACTPPLLSSVGPLADTHVCDAAEDTLSVSLVMCTVTHRDGRTTQLDQVYIRGASVRFFIVPDMLAQAPMYAHFRGHTCGMTFSHAMTGSRGTTRLEVSEQRVAVRPSCALKVYLDSRRALERI